MPAAVSSPHDRFIDLSEALIRVPLGPVACSHLMVTEGTVPNGTLISVSLNKKERTTRIELVLDAWEAPVLPLNHARTLCIHYYTRFSGITNNFGEISEISILMI